MRLRSAPWITACVLGALVSACRATQERAFAPAPSSERQSQAPADQGSGGSDGSFFGRPSYRLYGGTFEAEGNPGLANESHNATLGLGMSFPVRANPHWALDVDLIGTDRDYVASTFVPGQGVFNGTASLRTVGLTAGPRGTARAGPVRGYLGAGLGLFGSELAGPGPSRGSRSSPTRATSPRGSTAWPASTSGSAR